MKKALKILSFADIIFLILLILSATLEGIIGSVIYLLAFLVPFAIGFYYSRIFRTEREEERGLEEPLDTYFKLGKREALALAPVIAPSVAIIFFLAALTSLLLTSLGFSNPQPSTEGIFTMLIIHALCPAVLEEMLFRYIPMKLLAPYSKRWCTIFSALFFALIHANLFQMPYAFVAGVIFMTVNLALDSVWPSVILHFLNNAASVVWMKYCTASSSAWIFVFVLLALALISAVFIIFAKDRYKALVGKAFDNGAPEFDSRAAVALIVISLYVAITTIESRNF